MSETAAPTTLEELEARLARAKAAVQEAGEELEELEAGCVSGMS